MPTGVPNFKFLAPLVTDMEGIPEYKVGAADLLAVKLLYVAIVPANACQHSKFQLSGLRA